MVLKIHKTKELKQNLNQSRIKYPTFIQLVLLSQFHNLNRDIIGLNTSHFKENLTQSFNTLCYVFTIFIFEAFAHFIKYEINLAT